MRRFFYYIFILIAVTELSTVMTSCRHSRTVAALVEADSLMWTRPDSSLALVRSVSPDTLDDENRAYHALLLTQAQFRNNIYPDTDTIINRALDFYADNHNRERLTRSLIYKGLVYEVNVKPADAMAWYLKAEENADSMDVKNRAYIFLRKGVLYCEYFSKYHEDIHNFKKALFLYEKLGYVQQQIFCLSKIGGLYREYYPDTAITYLSRGLSLAYEVKDTTMAFLLEEYIARMNIHLNNYTQAIKTLLPIVTAHEEFSTNDMFLDLSSAYASLGTPDSARFYYDKLVGEPKDSVEDVIRNKILIRILASEGNYKEAYELGEVTRLRENRINDNELKNELYQTTERQKNDYILNISQTSVKQRYTIIWSVLLCVVLIVILIFVNYKNRTKTEVLQTLIEKRQELLLKANSLERKNNKNFVEKQIELIRQSLRLYSMIPENKEIREDLNIDKKERKFLWRVLTGYLDEEYGGVVTFIKENYGANISDFDLKIIALELCGFNSNEIAICLGYNSDSSIRSRKSRIKEKMGLEETLTEYLNKKKTESRDKEGN